jgi:glycosyltransferase involved in cell wall biosynthesis
VHVHFAYSYYGWLAAIAGCAPLAVSVMGGDVLFEEQGDPTPAGKWLTLQLLRRAHYITAKSDHLIAVLDRLGGFGAKAERIVWGVPLGSFRRVDAAPLRTRLGLRPDQRVVLSPKILQPFYRVHLVVEAMPSVLRAVPEAVLLVTEYAAERSYRERVANRVMELGLGERVRFCGHVQHAEMPAYYSLAELTVAVPSSDGLPQTLLEGMACETPSLLCRLPRYEEMVAHRVSAYFVDDDPASIAAGIIELFTTPELRMTIARNALAIVLEQANLEEQAARVERKFRELAATVPARAWSTSGLWNVWRAYRRFRRDPGSAA